MTICENCEKGIGMNYKKFGLVSLIISAIVIVVSVSLFFIKTDSPLNVGEPSYFVIYDNSISGNKIEKTNEKFDDIKKAFLNMTEMNIFDRVIQGGKLGEAPTQDIFAENTYYFTAQIKMENVCLEVVFDEMQHQIVSINGNTKFIEYKRLIFVIDESAPHLVSIYTCVGADGVYIDLPLTVRANTAELYKACMG